ncbi:DNA polymerase III subunit delta [Actinotignum sp. GS-2025g]|uniref:DNA polymerase III subunit delta n=1 Tax=Actinotignum sp. GS-2025g TaxID=3427280 RepID=UPI003F461391
MAAKERTVGYDALRLEPVILIIGAEPVLAERAWARLVSLARQAHPEVQVVRLDAASYERGSLALHTSPSLFGDHRIVIVTGAEHMNDAFLAEMLAYLPQPNADIPVIIQHGGGTRGKKLLDAIAAGGWQVARIEIIKRDDDKARLVTADVRAAGRKITDGAVRALVDALGQDLRELLSATAQLLADVEGMITEDHIRDFYAGRNEATPFEIADAALAGRTGQALALARHAFATRVNPVPIVAALAAKLRQLAIVQAPGISQKELKMAPWQAQRARREARGWSDAGLGHAIRAVALADEQVKGASRDPQYAVEHAIIAIGRARRGR